MQASDLSSKELSPTQWDAFILASPQGSVYAMHAYASAVAEGWRALIVEDAGAWKGVMPYYPKKKWGLQYALQPAFCQTWGPILAPPAKGIAYNRHSEQQVILEALASALPPFSYTYCHCHSDLEYILPFQQQGFQAGVRFTHLLALDKPESLRDGLSSQAKRKLKKSEKAGHSIRITQDPENLIQISWKNKQDGHDLWGGMKGAEVALQKLCCLPQSKVTVIEVLSPGGECVAAGAFAFWNGRAYYLAGGQVPALKNQGAMYRLLWQ